MISIKYSAVIRATKYSRHINQTIESLLGQNVAPSEIIIILPYGDYIETNINKKNIRIAHSERGMVAQRSKGIELTSYDMLLCDADVVLDQDVAEILLGPIEKGLAQCVVPYCDFYIKRTFIGKILDLIFGIRIPKKYGGIFVTCGGGFYVPTKKFKYSYYHTEIGPGLVIALSKEFASSKGIRGDTRFEKKSLYAYLEDAALIMQVVKEGGKALITDKARIIHLDEGTTKKGLRKTFCYIVLYNHYLFWKNYVYIRETKILWKLVSIILFMWTVLGIFTVNALFAVRSLIIKRSVDEIKSAIIGLIGFLLLYSKEKIDNL